MAASGIPATGIPGTRTPADQDAFNAASSMQRARPFDESKGRARWRPRTLSLGRVNYSSTSMSWTKKIKSAFGGMSAPAPPGP